MQVWDIFLAFLDSELGKETVDRWLRSLKILNFDAANLYLEALDSFQISWFEEHVRPRINKGKFTNNNGRPIRVHLSTPFAKKTEKSVTPPSTLTSDTLEIEMTFDSFVASTANTMAVRLLSDITHNHFNPIYLYGSSGCGKTHLLMATAHLLQQAGKNVIYVRAQTFTDHVIQAIRTGYMQDVRKFYRSAAALCIDDVHVFSKKTATQEEFFHTFNTLQEAATDAALLTRLVDGDPIQVKASACAGNGSVAGVA